MLGHQDPSEQAEILLLANLAESLNKVPTEAVRIKESGAAVGAGSDEMRVIQAVIMALPRHGAILQPEIAHIAKTAMSAPPTCCRPKKPLA